MAETKTKAFRADEKTINRINAWMERDGIGNSEALERMADIIDVSEAKGALAGRSPEISSLRVSSWQMIFEIVVAVVLIMWLWSLSE